MQAKITFDGLTVSGAAEEIGVNKGTLSRFLNMKREPDVQTANLLCFWLERELHEFVRKEFRD